MPGIERLHYNGRSIRPLTFGHDDEQYLREQVAIRNPNEIVVRYVQNSSEIVCTAGDLNHKQRQALMPRNAAVGSSSWSCQLPSQ